MSQPKTYEAPAMVVVGKIAKITRGDTGSFSDDGGHSGYKPNTDDLSPLASVPDIAARA